MNPPLGLVVVPLDREYHQRDGFACGNAVLDRYLATQAGQDLTRGVAAVFVAIRPGDASVLGYYTLSQASVSLMDLPRAQQKRLPRNPDVPVTLLGRLAVQREWHGRGVGALLLGDALRRVIAVARLVASTGLLVDAIDDAAVAFYAKFGFVAFVESPRRLFLPMPRVGAR
ncbi:MAG: GNAT family N-acetyltransferase [Gemmatimonadales bacterium]